MAVERGPVARALFDIARDGNDDHELAARICRACVAGTDVDGAAISVLTATEYRETLAATDTTAATVEDLQFTLGEGACIDAALSGRAVLVSDIQDHVLTAHWPMFAAAVGEQTGVRALFALPLQLGAINVGVIDLYRDTPGPLRGYELRDIVAATDLATLLLIDAQTQTDARQSDGEHRGGPEGDGSGRPGGLWSDRAEVHQATGMILAQLDVPLQDAFARLRAHAFAHQRPLSEIARDVVARRLVFTEDME